MTHKTSFSQIAFGDNQSRNLSPGRRLCQDLSHRSLKVRYWLERTRWDDEQEGSI